MRKLKVCVALWIQYAYRLAKPLHRRVTRASIGRSSVIWRDVLTTAGTFLFDIRGKSLRSCEKHRVAVLRTTMASPTNDSTGKWACSGRAQPKIIRERLGCLRVDDSFIPIARLDSSSRTIGNPE